MKPAATALIAGLIFVWGVLAAAWAPPPSVAPVLMHPEPDRDPVIGRASIPASPPAAPATAPAATAVTARPVPRPVGRAPLGTYEPGRAPSAPPPHRPETTPGPPQAAAASCGPQREHGHGRGRARKEDRRPGHCPAGRSVHGP